jgi:membrane-associated protein
MDGGISVFLSEHLGIDPLLAGFLFLVAYGFTTPIPEELALLLVGAAIHTAGRSYFEILPLAILALVTSDLIFYSIARFFGPRLLAIPFVRRILRPDRIEACERYFSNKGPRLLLACRFVVGLRMAAIVGAGLLRLRIGRFLANDLPPLLVGASAWLGAGYSLGPAAIGGFGPLGSALAVLGPVALLVAATLLSRRVMRLI